MYQIAYYTVSQKTLPDIFYYLPKSVKIYNVSQKTSPTFLTVT